MNSRSLSSLSKGASRAAVVVAGTAVALTVGAAGASATPVHHHHYHHAHLYQGREIARPFQWTHSSPGVHTPRVGRIYHGATVSIVCKVRDGWVDGNDRWYLVKDHNHNGAYSWASARYIANIGPAPAWCR